MTTAVSGSSPYCSAAQFILRVDERAVRQLLSDSGAAVTGSLTDNATLLTLLKEASGLVEAAACAGQRYVITSSRNDLSALTNNSAELLTGIVARLAYFSLWSRRPNPQSGERVPVACEMALDFLEQLRLGERVFGILENHEAAGLIAAPDRPSDVVARNGVAVIADRYFGRRANRLSEWLTRREDRLP